MSKNPKWEAFQFALRVVIMISFSIGSDWVGLDQNENENDLQGSISICPGDGDNEFSHFPAGVPFPLD